MVQCKNRSIIAMLYFTPSLQHSLEHWTPSSDWISFNRIHRTHWFDWFTEQMNLALEQNDSLIQTPTHWRRRVSFSNHQMTQWFKTDPLNMRGENLSHDSLNNRNESWSWTKNSLVQLYRNVDRSCGCLNRTILSNFRNVFELNHILDSEQAQSRSCI